MQMLAGKEYTPRLERWLEALTEIASELLLLRMDILANENWRGTMSAPLNEY